MIFIIQCLFKKTVKNIVKKVVENIVKKVVENVYLCKVVINEKIELKIKSIL